MNLNWYKKAQIITTKTRMDIQLNLSIKEFLAINDFLDHGNNQQTARDVLLRIIRTNPEILRLNTEGKIRTAQQSQSKNT